MVQNLVGFLPLLAREINWMETFQIPNNRHRYLDTLYSLEKLIEWKPENQYYPSKILQTLYSLEKLIEWKHLLGFVGSVILPFSLYSLEKLIEWKLL